MPPKAPKNAAKGGAPARKGPPAAVVAKLKQHLERQREEEERRKREAEEEERRLREEERIAEEQRRFEEEERARERQRRKEELRATRKDAKKSAQSGALERMAAAGFILPDVEKIREETRKEREDREAQRRRQPPKPKQQPKTEADATKQGNGAATLRPPSREEEEEEEEEDVDDGEVTVATESDEDVEEDDWEALMERDDRRAARHAENERIRKARLDRAEERRRKREERIRQRAEAAAAERAKEHVLESVMNLRSPICCVLGHVDTGKTSLLDRIRATNVQGGEAGGITQQIGATFFPRESLVNATADLNTRYGYDLNVPGLLVIDTPGHESFTNLRSRGSSLCDIAILVVDIMHGLEPQTRESIRLLRQKKCPFIVALNKVDRLYEWESNANMDIEQTLSKQKVNVRSEFDSRVSQVIRELQEEGLNSELYYKNKDMRKVVSIVPTSAKTGEGISDLLLLEIQLVQQFMEGKVTYKDDMQCTVLEVRPTKGHGITIDVILINGELHEGEDRKSVV